MNYCQICNAYPAEYRVAAPTGPQVTEDPQIVCCARHRMVAVQAIKREDFVIGPAYVDPLE